MTIEAICTVCGSWPCINNCHAPKSVTCSFDAKPDEYILVDGTTLSGPSARRLFDADATISRLTAEQEHLLSTNDRLFSRAVSAEGRVRELEKTLENTLTSCEKALAALERP